MFHLHTDASKVALYYLIEKIKQWDFDMVDVQQSTNHMKSLGAENIQREKFLSYLKKSLEKNTRRGKWK